MSDKQKAIILILLGSVLGGATQAVIKIGLVNFPPLSFAFVRFVISAIIISPFLFKTSFFRDFKKLIPFSLLATINIALFVIGIKTTTATIGTLLYAGVPLLTALFLFVFFKERLSKRKGIGIAIGFIGVILIALLPIIEKGAKFSGNLSGNMFIGIAVISWSLYMAFSKRKLESFSPFVITAVFIWVTCIALLPLFLADLRSYPNWWNSLTIPSVISVLYSSIISTILAFLLNQYVIKYGGVILASMHYYLLPIFAYLAAFFLLGERLTVGLVLGSILALLGVYITTKK
jgi:drug/metabolite transporter (DMT)-like permease